MSAIFVQITSLIGPPTQSRLTKKEIRQFLLDACIPFYCQEGIFSDGKSGVVHLSNCLAARVDGLVRQLHLSVNMSQWHASSMTSGEQNIAFGQLKP